MALTPSTVYVNFQRSKLAIWAETLDGIPGLGEKGIEKLKAQNITNGVQMMGMFLLENRNVARFREWLVDVVGLRPQEVDGVGGKPGLVTAFKEKADQILGI